MTFPRCAAGMVGLVAMTVIASARGLERPLASDQTISESELDAQYRAAIAAGAKPDVSKAGRLDAGTYRGGFRLRFGVRQYVGHSGRLVVLINSAEAADQRNMTVWTAEPETQVGRHAARYSLVLARPSVYWSVAVHGEKPTGRLSLRTTGGPAVPQEEEDFLFSRVVRDKALVRIRSTLGPREGYFQYVGATFLANASKNMASFFIVE